MSSDPERDWARWFLAERCGVDPHDTAAVRDLHETARGWALARGRRSLHQESLVDAVATWLGGIPNGWPEPFPQVRFPIAAI